MNKLFKRVVGIVCGTAMAAGVFALAACNDGNGGTNYDGIGSEYIVTHSEGKTATYTFEAENTNLGNKVGTAFSGTRNDINMINPGDSSASNGYCVVGLCKKGVSVNFVIVSDRDVTDATLVLRLGNEKEATFTFGPQDFLIRVDPVSDVDVKPYNEDGAWGKWDQLFLGYYYDSKTPIAANEDGTEEFAGYYIDEWDCGESITVTAYEQDPSGFEDYTITTKLSLQKGLNCISLITNNDTRPSAGSSASTLFATAPAVDCIKIKTDAQLGLYNPQDPLNLNKDACTVK